MAAMISIPALDDPHVVDAETVAGFQAKGHCVVRGLASAEEIAAFGPSISEAVAHYGKRYAPLEERDTYGKAFLQIPNLWTVSDTIRQFVFAPRFAKAAADLMDVAGVRLYHDQALFKEPGGGHTPWHQDQTYWPLDTDKTITMWMPLVDVPAEVGTMTFASGVHGRGDLDQGVIGDESEARLAQMVETQGFATETHGALRAGDATFHTGWTPHRAPANGADLMRSVMTIIWYADGTRIGPIDSRARRIDQKVWLDSIPTGELAAGPLNPLLWPPKGVSA
jgi:ectoine hydroxylase-related dioxygenase (phytanoyl-CoA dioxygenase family)